MTRMTTTTMMRTNSKQQRQMVAKVSVMKMEEEKEKLGNKWRWNKRNEERKAASNTIQS